MDIKRNYEYLLSDLSSLKGIGIKTANLLKRKKINSIFDLLWKLPKSYTDRSLSSKIKDLKINEIQTLNFINDFNLNFELLSDLDYKMSKDYGTFFVSEEFGNSINRSTFLIDENGVIINIWRDIKNPDSHPDDVLNFLNSL